MTWQTGSKSFNARDTQSLIGHFAMLTQDGI